MSAAALSRVFAIVLAMSGAALAGCAARTAPTGSIAQPPPAASDEGREPPTPGIKPLTVEQEESISQ
jgi:hypothetical protein